MRNLITVLLALAATACAATPAALPAPLPATEAAAPQPPPSFRWWSTGEALFAYHQVWGDCDTLVHTHGRNAAWGLWEMPLAEAIEHGAEETDEGTALVRLTCRGGSACMRKGALSTAADPISEHAVPFATMALARQYTEAVAALKTACQLPN